MAGILLNSDPVSIITSITVYCEKCNRRTAGVVLEMALKKLKEEGKEIDRDIFHLTMDYQTRKTSEVYFRMYKAGIDVKREKMAKMTLTSVSEENLHKLMSEPKRLTTEFEEGINYIREQVARTTNDKVQIN
jgi:hypothetical protein